MANMTANAPASESSKSALAAIPRRALAGGAGEMRGCPFSTLRGKLREAGFRPTRQRIALGWLLFGQGDRHVSAEDLYDEANRARHFLSLATVYNTLRQFSEAGLIRPVAIGGGRTVYDTRTDEHCHFLLEDGKTIIDARGPAPEVEGLPAAPEGYEIEGVEILVRLRKSGT
jgi:Fur family transcriptional regulator, iron response regulator